MAKSRDTKKDTKKKPTKTAKEKKQEKQQKKNPKQGANDDKKRRNYNSRLMNNSDVFPSTFQFFSEAGDNNRHPNRALWPGWGIFFDIFQMLKTVGCFYLNSSAINRITVT